MRTKTAQLVTAAIIALLLHGMLLIGLRFLPKAEMLAEAPPQSKPIKVHLKSKEPETPKRQLVKIEPPKEDRKPRHAEYMSEFNSQTDKQTQAANKDAEPKKASAAKQARAKSQGQQTQVKRGKGPAVPNLMPKWQDFQAAEPRAATAFNDNLNKDIETSAETRLNTFEWKHATYFNRIKESVSRTWRPLLDTQIKRYDPMGALMTRDQLTVLEVTIDAQGNVVNTSIKTKSTAFYLDQGAVMAFEQASPFPNPPKALFATADNFTFNFGFMVSLGKRFSLDFD
ncbi:MAG: TonB family protein [Myxococcota bacterium]